MRYFFKEGAALAAGRVIELDPADLNHAYRVLRLRKGSTVVIANGRDAAFQGTVEEIGPGRGLVRLNGPPLPTAESPRQIILLQGLAKGEKMDQIIRQAVELGVQQIIPVVTERSIARFSESREAGRLQRWRNLVRAAAKQCRRAALPDLSSVHDFNRVLDYCRGG